MATTAQKRTWWADWRCNPSKMTAVTFPGAGRDWHLPIADAAVPAFELFASLMRKHNYLFREVSGGTYNCRYIDNNPAKGWSLHAYGIAIDLNPSKNPYGTSRHNYPQGFINDVLATGLFKWLNTFDPMHWEIDVPPSQIGDTMAFTAHEERQLKRIIASLDEVDSDGSFAKYTVLHLRNHPSSGTVDSTARSTATAARNKVDDLLAKLRKV